MVVATQPRHFENKTTSMLKPTNDAGARQSMGGVQQRLMQAHTALFAVLRAVGQVSLSRHAVNFAWIVRAVQVRRTMGYRHCACWRLTWLS
jgi:hypothetical protein